VARNIQHEFGLNESQLSLLFGAFALAYSIFEVPSGWLGDVFGPRVTLIRIVLWWSVFTALTGLIWPVSGYLAVSFWLLVGVRFCFGMGEAGAYPNIARAFHNWFPFGERGFAKGAVWMAGRFMGGATPLVVNYLLITVVVADNIRITPAGAAAVIGTGLAGPLAQVDAAVVNCYPPVVHWRHIFYVFGILGMIWCCIFWWWFRDRPEQNQSVNTGELDLIRTGKIVSNTPSSGGVPWKRLLLSGNLWLLCITYFCSAYGWYFNITYLPGYLTEVYGLNRQENPFWAGLLTGAPLLCGAVACLLGGLLTDAFIRYTGNRKWGRRLFGVVGKGTCGLCYFASMFAPNVELFVLAVAMAAFWNDMAMGSAWASCLDIGRKYSGIVAGCMNTVGNFGGFMAGIVTGQVLQFFSPDRTLAWRINFMTFTGVYVLAVVLWLFFDSTKPVVDED
jgi:MFS transporter, ACS family, glucarate transporter